MSVCEVTEPRRPGCFVIRAVRNVLHLPSSSKGDVFAIYSKAVELPNWELLPYSFGDFAEQLTVECLLVRLMPRSAPYPLPGSFKPRISSAGIQDVCVYPVQRKTAR